MILFLSANLCYYGQIRFVSALHYALSSTKNSSIQFKYNCGYYHAWARKGTGVFPFPHLGNVINQRNTRRDRELFFY